MRDPRRTPGGARPGERRPGLRAAAAGRLSALSVPGGPFHAPAADAALFDAIHAGCGTAVEVEEHDGDINDPRFARALADRLAAWV